MIRTRSIPMLSRRRAFTLIELLVVIAIIVVLASLTAAGVFYLVGNRQKKNTEETFRTVDKFLQQHWAYVVEEARKETPSDIVKAMAAPDPTGERAKILWTKVRLTEAFPVSIGEITAPGVYAVQGAPYNGPMIPVSQRKNLKNYSQALAARTGPTSPKAESALCLALALNRLRGSQLRPDDLGPGAADTDNDGLKEIVDGYLQPIRFYRFGWTKPPPVTEAPNMQTSNPATGGITEKFADPLDPRGHFLTWSPAGTWRNTFESGFHRIQYPAPPPLTVARYVRPVLVSAGLDEKLGLFEPNQCPLYGISIITTSPGNPNIDTPDPNEQNFAKDNVYSFNLRLN